MDAVDGGQEGHPREIPFVLAVSPEHLAGFLDAVPHLPCAEGALRALFRDGASVLVEPPAILVIAVKNAPRPVVVIVGIRRDCLDGAIELTLAALLQDFLFLLAGYLGVVVFAFHGELLPCDLNLSRAPNLPLVLLSNRECRIINLLFRYQLS
jgi:hypothetical protein